MFTAQRERERERDNKKITGNSCDDAHYTSLGYKTKDQNIARFLEKENVVLILFICLFKGGAGIIGLTTNTGRLAICGDRAGLKLHRY